FLSYNSRDRAVVQQVRTLLGARGVSVFYDRESLGLGRDWFEPLERALRQVHGVVVFLGPNGLGRWQRRELALALDRQTTEPTFPVIPVLLPESQVEDYGGFLLQNTYADLRGKLDDPETLDAIERAVRDPAAAGGPAPPPETAAIRPYLSLNAFLEEDAPLFFGRDRLVDEPEQGLLHKVLTRPLVAVVGASGSGKSSVVLAGLLPRLRRESPSRGTWDVVTFRPGKYPFLNLAIALEAVRNPEASAAARETDAAALGKDWSSGDVPLELSLGRTREALRADRLLVVVDQYEELVTLTPKDDRLPFLSRLLAATDAESKITVLLTLRADYYSAIDLDPRLSDDVQRGLVNVGAMTRDERRSAIEGPARRVRLEFEPGLVDRLLDDVGDEPGDLPLLEFALTELWERREGRRLTNAAYEALGRVAGAIGQHADAVFARLTREQQAAAPRLFGRLVRLTAAGEEGADTRQRVRLGDLDEASHSAVEPFVAGRLLVTARDPGTSTAEASPDDGPAPAALDDPTTVEVAHEALIRRWERLRGWLKDDRAFLLWRQRLGLQIAEWERSGRDVGALLRGALLKEVHRFVRSRRNDLNERERKFLAQSESQSRRSDHEQRALALFKAIQTADLSEVPRLVNQLRPYRSFVGPWLTRSLQESKDDSKEHLNSSLALLPVDAGQVEYLYNRLLNTNPVDLPVIREALKDHRGMIVERFWAVLENPQADSGQRFQAACALAHYDATGAGSKWDAVSRFISDRLLASVIENPSLYTPLIEMVRPVRDRLLTPLITTFHDKNEPGSKRALAASILADYASNKPEMLSDLLMDATPEQYAILFPKAQAQGQPVLASLECELAKKASPEAKDDEKDRLAQRQANAAVALVRLGRPENVWPLLRHSPDPSVRSYIVNWLKLLGADPKALMAKLEVLDPGTSPTPSGGPSRMDDILFHPETSVRRALILALGEYQAEELSSGEREPLVVKLLRVYRHDPDSGIHGAAEWTLRRWNQEEKLKAVDSELKTTEDWGKRRWYLNSEGQTLAVIEGPVEFLMGSPPTEPEHLDAETQQSMRINRRFAIATKEVTVMQYERFVRANQGNQRHKISGVERFSPDLQGPQVSINWYDAAAYCNWLSQQEGLAACYEPNPEGEYAEGMKIVPDFLDRPGYRLPMEAEWEYACRAGAVTSRYYGGSVELLGKYAWYSQNSRLRAWPCGQLKPNDFGLFDLLGNAYEWCQDAAGPYTQDGDQGERDNINKFQFLKDNPPRIIRGGSFHYPPAFVRSAFRFRDLPLDRIINIGFRPARTYP
ncbi:MAG: SUMF1/EgtB/PvdO family nonheme iron enzyme, partial [Planctomycetaceae bacterium]|nr:SUMF1/EgtB/PvdO family nonheme iron enzyme [Planctomycetaceae bacterium]